MQNPSGYSSRARFLHHHFQAYHWPCLIFGRSSARVDARPVPSTFNSLATHLYSPSSTNFSPLTLHPLALTVFLFHTPAGHSAAPTGRCLCIHSFVSTDRCLLPLPLLAAACVPLPFAASTHTDLFPSRFWTRVIQLEEGLMWVLVFRALFRTK